jgi:hypothetical protein
MTDTKQMWRAKERRYTQEADLLEAQASERRAQGDKAGALALLRQSHHMRRQARHCRIQASFAESKRQA